MRVARYVALGDSQTEGLNDPDGAGGFIGWADRLAVAIAAQNPGLRYANLAVRGRRVADIRAEQLDAACALRPDLATVMAGVNDLIGPRFQLEPLAEALEAMYGGLAAAGATVVTCTFPVWASGVPMAHRLRPRSDAFNHAVREAADRHGALVVDFANFPAVCDARLWSEDRLHLNPTGHALVARAFAHTLGLTAADSSWQTPLPAAPVQTRRQSAAADVTWAYRYMRPWMVRRLRGRSSGDGRTAKRPELTILSGD